jgi:type II secretory pathway predicted ATPase ExeA
MSTMMDFRSRFGFHSAPFTREFAVPQRFALDFFEEALTGLLRAVQQRASAALVAPAGTGKTALLRALMARLPETRYRVHYVKVACLSKRDMCREIAVACSAQSAGSYPMLVRRLQERFETATAQDGVRPVLILDEAQDLRPEVLDMLRILTNFDMDSRLVLSVVLAGQPPLGVLLRRDSHEAIARRLSHVAGLRLLSREESQRYIAHRCTIAGATMVPFDAAALDAVYEIAVGNLRATDQIAGKALEIAHDAGVTVVDSSHVVQARRVLFS